jgi:hypothetical protein
VTGRGGSNREEERGGERRDGELYRLQAKRSRSERSSHSSDVGAESVAPRSSSSSSSSSSSGGKQPSNMALLLEEMKVRWTVIRHLCWLLRET